MAVEIIEPVDEVDFILRVVPDEHGQKAVAALEHFDEQVVVSANGLGYFDKDKDAFVQVLALDKRLVQLMVLLALCVDLPRLVVFKGLTLRLPLLEAGNQIIEVLDNATLLLVGRLAPEINVEVLLVFHRTRQDVGVS